MFRLTGTSIIYAEVEGLLIPVDEHNQDFKDHKVIELNIKEFSKLNIAKNSEIKVKTL